MNNNLSDIYNEFLNNFNFYYPNATIDNNLFEDDIFINILIKYIDSSDWLNETLVEKMWNFNYELFNIINKNSELIKYFDFSNEIQ